MITTASTTHWMKDQIRSVGFKNVRKVVVVHAG